MIIWFTHDQVHSKGNMGYTISPTMISMMHMAFCVHLWSNIPLLFPSLQIRSHHERLISHPAPTELRTEFYVFWGHLSYCPVVLFLENICFCLFVCFVFELKMRERDREAEREREKSEISWFYSPILATARADPSQSQEPRTLPRSPTW